MSPTRRAFLAAMAMPAASTRAIRVEDVHIGYEEYRYRARMKFAGAAAIDRATILNVHCVAATRDGRRVRGFGSMKLGNTWSFRSRVLSYDDTLRAMQALAGRIACITRDCREFGHPFDLNTALEPAYLRAAAEVGRELKLPEPIPKLCTLVTASAFDAAIHDAYGKTHGVNAYCACGPTYMPNDLARYLDRRFQGQYPDRYLLRKPKPSLPLYHLVGSFDPVTGEDVTADTRIGDGLPETLAEWIVREGLTHFKVKLRGDDLAWDLARVERVHSTVVQAQTRLKLQRRFYSLDFNEMCPNVDYLLDFLHRLKERSPGAYAALQYIEQPTRRDLKADRANVMHAAARLKPVVIDESLTDYETLLLAREMGYSGAALKACKGTTHSILTAAAAQYFKLFLCVQDLTCPGASLLLSAGLAAHVPTIGAIEANARQYVPAANAGWEKKFPGIFSVRGGAISTAALDLPGLLPA